MDSSSRSLQPPEQRSRKRKRARKRERKVCKECNGEFSHSAFYRHIFEHHTEQTTANQQTWDELFSRDQSDLADCSSSSSCFAISCDEDDDLNDPSRSENNPEESTNTHYEIEGHEQLETCNCDGELDNDAGPFLTSDSSSSSDEDAPPPELFDEEDDNCSNEFTSKDSQIHSEVGSVIYMTAVFLMKWQYRFRISDNAMNCLIKFLNRLFFILMDVAKVTENLLILANGFPNSLVTLKNHLKLTSRPFKQYSSCKKCTSIYENLSTKFCRHKPFPANPTDPICDTLLLKSIKCKGETKLVPMHLYFYHPLKSSLSMLLQKEGYISLLQHWRKRSQVIPEDWVGDVYDGEVWKELFDSGYLESPFNLVVALNIDWFQPYSRVMDSVGVIYLCVLNLPRHLRYKQENILLVGIIPGPKEPKLVVNAFLSPLVDELKEFWTGVNIQVSNELNIKFRIVLACIMSDMPAVRKACGFVGHRARLGCSKCLCEFEHLKGGGMKWSGTFGNWPLRTIDDHRKKSDEYHRCLNENQQKEMASKNGFRFSVLNNVPFFNPIRHHVIDPMHNLLLGTAKHMMDVWIKLGLLGNKEIIAIEMITANINCPYDTGRLPLKVGSSFHGFTADQWKVWTTVYSPIALKKSLPDNHLRVWLLFVRACSMLCKRLIKKSEIGIACAYLEQFCLKCIDVYGHKHFTPNMHMHTHLQECCNDYGSVYGFWCFAFERYNGILGSYQTNKRCIEAQLMNKFLLSQRINCLSVSKDLIDIYSLLKENEKGSLKSNEEISMETTVKIYQLSSCSFTELQRIYSQQLYFSIDDCEHLDLLPKIYERVLNATEANHIKMIYSILYPSYEVTHFPLVIQQSNSAALCGQLFHSKKCKGTKSSVFTANWSVSSSTDFLDQRIGQINYFLKHDISLKCVHTQKTTKTTHVFAHNSWFKKHVHHDWYGCSAIICETDTEDECCFNYIPLQRLEAPCAFGELEIDFDLDNSQTVFVAIPLPSTLYA